MVSLKFIRTALKGVAAPHRPSESPSTVSDSSGPQAAGMLLHVNQLTGEIVMCRILQIGAHPPRNGMMLHHHAVTPL